MTTLREAAARALEAMDALHRTGDTQVFDLCHRETTEALRAALAQQAEPVEPVQEPVAWMTPGQDLHLNNGEGFRFSDWTPLYASPQPQQTEPSQDTPPQHEYEVTANDDGTFSVGLPDGEELRIIPPQRKPATIDEMFDRMDKAPKGVFFGHDPMTIWMEAWRAAEQHHGVKKAHEP